MILRVTAVRTPEGMWPGLPHTLTPTSLRARFFLYYLANVSRSCRIPQNDYNFIKATNVPTCVLIDLHRWWAWRSTLIPSLAQSEQMARLPSPAADGGTGALIEPRAWFGSGGIDTNECACRTWLLGQYRRPLAWHALYRSCRIRAATDVRRCQILISLAWPRLYYCLFPVGATKPRASVETSHGHSNIM